MYGGPPAVLMSGWSGLFWASNSPVFPLKIMFTIYYYYYYHYHYYHLSQWPRGLRRRSAAARLLGLRVRIPPWTCLTVVSVVCFKVEVSASGWSHVQRSPTEYGVPEYDRESSIIRRSCPLGGLTKHEKILLLLFPNFLLLSFGWEIFTYPGMW